MNFNNNNNKIDFSSYIVSTFLQSTPCTYHLSEVFLETDQVTDQEKDFIRNCIYRQELLNIFDLEDFDEKELEIHITELYKIFEKDETFDLFLEKLKVSYPFIPREQLFVLLFSFDYLHATQLCILEYFETSEITAKNKELIISIIDKPL
jgi:hypothetical protein